MLVVSWKYLSTCILPNFDLLNLGCCLPKCANHTHSGYYSTYPDPSSCECEPCSIGTYNNTDMFYLQDVVQATTFSTQIHPAVSVNPTL